jgi:hypothetical protein
VKVIKLQMTTRPSPAMPLIRLSRLWVRRTPHVAPDQLVGGALRRVSRERVGHTRAEADSFAGTDFNIGRKRK